MWRGITGREVDRELGARVTYSRVTVKRFVRRVRRAVNRAPREADVSFTRPACRRSRRARACAWTPGACRRRWSPLDSIGGGRNVRGRVKVVQPKVTTADLADKYPQVVTVDCANFKLRLFKDLKLTKTYKIAVGQIGLETPAGVYHVQNKATDPAWYVPNSDWAGELAEKVIPGGVPENPLKSRWLGIYAGAGIHGTDAISSLGTAACHGCTAWLCPTSRSCTTRCRCRPPSTSSSQESAVGRACGPVRISSTETSCHPWLSKEPGGRRGEYKGADPRGALSPSTCLRRTE